MTTVFDEVLAVAKSQGVRDKLPGQSDQDYLYSIAKALATCPIETWDSLRAESHVWYDKVVRSSNELKQIPEPEGFRVQSTIQAPVGAVILNKPQPIPIAPPIIRPVESGRIQSVVPNIANTLQAASKSRMKPEGVIGAIRKTIIINPTWPTRLVHEYLTKNGWPQLKLDVVAVNAGDIRKTIIMAQEMGYWHEPEKQ